MFPLFAMRSIDRARAASPSPPRSYATNKVPWMITLNLHSPLLPLGSIAQYVTLVTPIKNRDPIGGFERNATNRMLSVAEGLFHVTPEANASPGSVVVTTLVGHVTK